MNEQLKRIILDIQDLQKSPIEEIHYFPCEDNITFGYALIFGPKETPYEYGNFLFRFEFPKEYPYAPPKVVYLSNDGKTRFNPNFYRDGKVCLSLLNTWQGEKWSACQSIRSVLITLQMTMNDTPLLNEPGITEETHFVSIRRYNRLIAFKTKEWTVLRYMLYPKEIPIQNEEIIACIRKHYEEKKEDLWRELQTQRDKSHNNTIIRLNIYSQEARIDYDQLIAQFERLQ